MIGNLPYPSGYNGIVQCNCLFYGSAQVSHVFPNSALAKCINTRNSTMKTYDTLVLLDLLFFFGCCGRVGVWAPEVATGGVFSATTGEFTLRTGLGLRALFLPRVLTTGFGGGPLMWLSVLISSYDGILTRFEGCTISTVCWGVDAAVEVTESSSIARARLSGVEASYPRSAAFSRAPFTPWGVATGSFLISIHSRSLLPPSSKSDIEENGLSVSGFARAVRT